MRAIINVHPTSSYANLNGRTFNVENLTPKGFDVLVNKNTVWFSHKEAFVVDIEHHYSSYAKACSENANKEAFIYFTYLKNYIRDNNIDI